MDSNYSSRSAKYGKVSLISGDKKPTMQQVPDGVDYPYRCFEYSLKQFMAQLENNNQPSLFQYGEF